LCSKLDNYPHDDPQAFNHIFISTYFECLVKDIVDNLNNFIDKLHDFLTRINGLKRKQYQIYDTVLGSFLSDFIYHYLLFSDKVKCTIASDNFFSCVVRMDISLKHI
jgi:hypothetical protein